MKNSLPLWLSAAATLLTPALGQTSTKCDPTNVTCPADPALSDSRTYDFTKGLPSDFSIDSAAGLVPTYDSNGANLQVTKGKTYLNMVSNWYIMFGYVEVTLKAAKGTGIVTAVDLISDDLDELDWEMVGPDNQHAQTNYFGKGCECGFGRGTYISSPNVQDQFHTYKIEWTSDVITWWIDDDKANARVLKQSDVPNSPKRGPQWPQTPMKLTIGLWADGRDNSWDGGPANFNDGPNVMQVKSAKAIDYSTGKFYSYGDKSGSWQSIKSDTGVINANGNANSQPGKDSGSSNGTGSGSTGSGSTGSGSTGSGSTGSGSTGSGSTGSGSTGSGSTGSGSTGSGSSGSGSADTTCTTLTITSGSSTYTTTSTLGPSVTSISQTVETITSNSATIITTRYLNCTSSATVTSDSSYSSPTNGGSSYSSPANGGSVGTTVTPPNSANTSPSVPIHTGAGAALRVQHFAAGLVGLVALAPLFL